MGLFDRFRSRPGVSRPKGDRARTGSTTVRASDRTDEEHLHQWCTTREGIEGFVEPRTAVSDVTLLLVAWDGEWTRRRVPSPEWAEKFCRKQGFRCYDAAVVGIPTRMREYIQRQKERER